MRLQHILGLTMPNLMGMVKVFAVQHKADNNALRIRSFTGAVTVSQPLMVSP